MGLVPKRCSSLGELGAGNEEHRPHGPDSPWTRSARQPGVVYCRERHLLDETLKSRKHSRWRERGPC